MGTVFREKKQFPTLLRKKNAHQFEQVKHFPLTSFVEQPINQYDTAKVYTNCVLTYCFLAVDLQIILPKAKQELA